MRSFYKSDIASTTTLDQLIQYSKLFEINSCELEWSFLRLWQLGRTDLVRKGREKNDN